MKKTINYEEVAHVDVNTGMEICRTQGRCTITDNQKSEEEIKRNEKFVNIDPNFCKKVGFVKLNDNVIDVLIDKLTPTEFAFFMKLSKFVSYTDCILRRTSHGNSKIMDMKDMAEEMGMSYDQVRRIVPQLKKKGLMGVHETGSLKVDSAMKKSYTINPFVMYKGQKMNRTVAEFYRGNGWDELLKERNTNEEMEKYIE